jgi:hypothetical protein
MLSLNESDKYRRTQFLFVLNTLMTVSVIEIINITLLFYR